MNLHLILFIFVSVASLKRYDKVQSTCHLAPMTKPFQVKVYSGLFPCSQLLYKKHTFLKSHKVSSRGHLLYLFSLVILQSHDCHPNPGPHTPKYPCQVCGKACRWSKTIKSVARSSCELWYHKDCMQMNTAICEALEKTDVSWCCFKCCIPNFDKSLLEDFKATLDTSRSSISTRNGSLTFLTLGTPNQHHRQTQEIVNLLPSEASGFSTSTFRASAPRKKNSGACWNIQNLTLSLHLKLGFNPASLRERSSKQNSDLLPGRTD